MIPRRYYIALMIFLSCFYNDMIKVNLSVNLVAMVPVTNNTVSANQRTISWSAYERALLLSSYSWGFLAGNLSGGYVGQRFSPKILMFIAILGGGLMTLISPTVAKLTYVGFLVIRIVIGYFGGIAFPLSHCLIANWATPNERGIFVGALISGSLGTFVSWTICGFVIDAFGWEWGFYAFTVFLPFVVALWWYLVYDTPSEHPTILPDEKEYLEDFVELNKEKPTKNRKVPTWKFLTSIPAISLLILNFSTGWGVHFVRQSIPSYVANGLGYDIKSTGYLSALTYLLRPFSAFLIGGVADVVLKRKLMTLNLLRKVAVIFSHMIPGCGLLSMVYPNFPKIVYVMLLVVTMGLNGFVSITSAANIHDLTANYAGALSGFPISFITCAGIVTPIVTAHLIKEDETSLDLWRSVLYLAAAMYLFSGLQFIIFGSTKHQSWDKIEMEK